MPSEAEVPILWPLDVKGWFTGKDSDARNCWRQKEKRVTEDEMVGWHHQLNGHEFEQTRRQWRTGKPGTLQSMGSQRVGHDLATGQQQQQQMPSRGKTGHLQKHENQHGIRLLKNINGRIKQRNAFKPQRKSYFYLRFLNVVGTLIKCKGTMNIFSVIERSRELALYMPFKTYLRVFSSKTDVWAKKKIQKTEDQMDNTKSWWGCGATRTPIHRYWEGKMVLWKTVWRFLIKLNILIIWSSVCTHGIYTKKLETYVYIKTCTQMFTAAFFIISKTWKQPRGPSVGEWINKLWYINQDKGILCVRAC